MLEDWQERERWEEEEVRYAEERHQELIADEPSPFCPVCEYMPARCNCMVYGRKLFPSEREPYDWPTRYPPTQNEDYIEIMRFQDWCGEAGEQWRLKNLIQYETIHVKDEILEGGLVVPYYEIREKKSE